MAEGRHSLRVGLGYRPSTFLALPFLSPFLSYLHPQFCTTSCHVGDIIASSSSPKCGEETLAVVYVPRMCFIRSSTELFWTCSGSIKSSGEQILWVSDHAPIHLGKGPGAESARGKVGGPRLDLEMDALVVRSGAWERTSTR